MDLYELYRIVDEKTVICVYRRNQDGQIVMMASAFKRENKPFPGTDYDSWTVKCIRAIEVDVLSVEVAR